MAHQHYPGKRYHATEPPRYVQNADEDAALGPGWFDSPTKAMAVRVLDDEPPFEAPPKRRGRPRTDEL